MLHNSPRRIGVSNGEVVLLDRTEVREGLGPIRHGHVRSLDSLDDKLKKMLIKAGLVDKKGRQINP